jgi:hypothetical protein
VHGGRYPEWRRLCRPSTYGEAVNARQFTDDERPAALTHHPPVAGRGPDCAPDIRRRFGAAQCLDLGASRLRRPWKACSSIRIRERDRGDAVGA